MPSRETSDLKVMVVEDNEGLADAYAEVLAESYDTEVSYSGQEALESMDGSVDIVLLDRKMPGMNGDEVLNEIRQRDCRCGVSMVTAVSPDFDIIEMGFDDYVVKPVEEGDLVETVEQVNSRVEQKEAIREYVSSSVKKATLEGMKSSQELEESERYQNLIKDVREMSSDLGDISADMSEEEFEKIMRNVVRQIGGRVNHDY
jgi:DNA-binding response OmpR family regulator